VATSVLLNSEEVRIHWKVFPACLGLSCSSNCVMKYQDSVDQLQDDVLLV